MFSSWENNDELNDFDRQLLSSNIAGAKTLKELFEIERDITFAKEIIIRKNGVNGDFDYEHLKAIHKEFFKDIYVWAGMDRYDIGYRGVFRKGSTEFTRGESLPEIATQLFTALRDENYFTDLSKEELIKGLASLLNGINILHPFRDGNGRTQRLFIELLANNAGYELNLSNVTQSIMIQASIQGSKRNIKGYEIILKENLKSKSHLEKPEPIKLKSHLESSSEKMSDIHPSPFPNPFKKP